MRLGFVGTGTIASAVVRGLARDGHRITVSERSARHSAALAAEIPDLVVADNQGVVDASDVVFLGLLPDAAPEILSALRFRAGQRVISFMAGVDLAEVAALCAPAGASALMLPFPGIAQGGSPVLAMGDTDLVARIFGGANTIFTVPDAAQMQTYLSAQAVLSPAVAMVGNAAEWMAGRGVDPEMGEAFLRLLVGSSLQTSGCAPLLEALNTPGGFNQRLRVHMEEAGTPETLKAGLDRLAKG
ncbi:NAD(P)-binding domain-containing protein [Rhodobacter sp. NTK016B]|nr:NAD(P)-binding domain-containing protein [Rhodobacter sp. NTK016B]MBN8293114.1 NAD(P)-binding domain-containing protein [Rhodobacter sp. NTK016B]